MSRKCGDCSACCFGLAVLDLKPTKDQYTWCPHCTKPGCGIYRRRPPSCRDYACAWLQGEGRDDEQPHLTGWIVDETMQAAGDGAFVPVTSVRALRARNATPMPEYVMTRLINDVAAGKLVCYWTPGCEQTIWHIPKRRNAHPALRANWAATQRFLAQAGVSVS